MQETTTVQKQFGGPMNEMEQALVRDMQGFLEFSIRNGLSLPVVLSSLGHDVNALATRYAFSLEDASQDGFRPKVTGYAHITEEDVGQPAEVD